MAFRNFKRLIVGSPLTTEMMHSERIPKWKALAVLSSDALSSVAYATEEVLIPLALFATAAVAWSMPIAIGIAVLLLIVTISYRQTIDAYPSGGGAYTVAKENLGDNAGLVAAAALLIDYVLTVAVSVSAGIENIASAFPILLPFKVLLGVFCVTVIMIMNLRGVRESANVFALPTYLFIFSFLIMIGVGFWNLATGATPAVAPIIHETYPGIPLFLLLRAFSSGCVALTGIEAISNGIPIFREPAQRNAKITMAWMAFILGAFFLAITLLSHLYGVVPKEGETAVSLLAHQVFGDSLFYYVIPTATTLILILAANTSYADFPRLSSLLAKDRYLPRQLASLGDRLVFSNGIGGLSLAAVFLIIVFGGDTHSLIPLYAVGVFLSFTLSQVGMIRHHLRDREPHWKKGLVFNTLGAITTAMVLLIIGVTKFIHGAWVVVLLIPVFVFIFRKIHRHYAYSAERLTRPKGVAISQAKPLKHTAIVPVSGVHQGVIDALSYGLSISHDVRACYVELDPEGTARIQADWQDVAPQIPLVILKSPYRSVISPVLKYVVRVEREMNDDIVTVIIPEFVTTKWYHQLLHNQTAIVLSLALRTRKKVVVTSVRYHLDG
ncbi:MAG: APC family permease [Bdellovibrionales bacterium]